MYFMNFKLHAGDVFNTVLKFLTYNPGFRVSVVNFDLDTEESTYFCRNVMWPRIVRGGLVIFVEYSINEWTESNCADRFIHEKNLKLIRTDFYAPSA